MPIIFLLISILALTLNVSVRYEAINDNIDTLRHPNFECDAANGKCSVLDTYDLKSGILISGYYDVLYSLPINLNHDQYVDTILVLSPKTFQSSEPECNLSFKRSPKRLLVEIITNATREAVIRSKYDNLISDIGGVLSHFSGIFLTPDGFEIVHEAGSKYSWHYVTKFSVSGDRIVLRQISKTCSIEGNGETFDYLFNDVDAHNLNIPDTLANQCNCDSVWSK